MQDGRSGGGDEKEYLILLCRGPQKDKNQSQGKENRKTETKNKHSIQRVLGHFFCYFLSTPVLRTVVSRLSFFVRVLFGIKSWLSSLRSIACWLVVCWFACSLSITAPVPIQTPSGWSLSLIFTYIPVARPKPSRPLAPKPMKKKDKTLLLHAGVGV